MNKYLIVNADDFGWDNDTFESTIKLFEIGSITSATIMTGMSATDDAINYARNNQNRFSFGLHFNILDGHIPKYISDKNSLTDESGRFKIYRNQVMDAMFLKLRKEDIQKELELQLSELFDAGIKVSHIDTHGHVHKFPPILLAIIQVIKRYNIKIIRCPQNLFQMWGVRKTLVNNVFKMFFSSILKPDYFFMLEDHNDTEWFNKICIKIKQGITEIGIHPGEEEPWRKVEKQPFIKIKYFDLMSNNDIELINYNFAKGLKIGI